VSPTPRLDPDALAALEEQRDFLLRSLDDLEREHDAGDLDDDDHRELRDDYTARAAEVLRAIDEHRSAFADAARPRSLGRTLAVAGAVAVFAVLSGVLVAGALGARQAGDSATGGLNVKRTPSQRAQSCIEKMSEPATAVTCFQDVLDDDPRNVVALTWLGWTLELSSSSVSPEQATQLQGAATDLVDRAVEYDPDYSYARAFRAVLAYRRGDFARAKEYLADFRARKPSPDAAAVIDQMDLEAGIAEGLKGGGSSTTTPAITTPATTAPGATTTTAPG
jgi:tetratricopeptide (TPR) repeat protein